MAGEERTPNPLFIEALTVLSTVLDQPRIGETKDELIVHIPKSKMTRQIKTPEGHKL